jgi:hypothetical protein
MKISKNVLVGTVLLAGIAFTGTACASEPDQEFMDTEADHQQMCVQVQDNGDLIRDHDAKCPDEDEHHAHFDTGFWYWYYLGRVYGTPPAVGQQVPIGGSFVRPSSGTIARPPATGGFGSTKVSVGG